MENSLENINGNVLNKNSIAITLLCVGFEEPPKCGPLPEKSCKLASKKMKPFSWCTSMHQSFEVPEETSTIQILAHIN